MNAYWITFEDGTTGSCQGETERDAKAIAEHVRGVTVTSAESLPQMSLRPIWRFDHPVYGVPPPFCQSPNKCKGHEGCPHRRSCTS